MNNYTKDGLGTRFPTKAAARKALEALGYKNNIPQSAYIDGRINQTDATNFCSVLHSLRYEDEKEKGPI